MARRSSSKKGGVARPAPAPAPRPSRPATTRPEASRGNPAQDERAARQRAALQQQAIYASRYAVNDDSHGAANRGEGLLSRTPAHIANPARETLARLEAEKLQRRREELRRSLLKKSRHKLSGALTDTSKPERSSLRSTEKLRALKCKSRPKKTRPQRGGGGGGKKRFIPWC